MTLCFIGLPHSAKSFESIVSIPNRFFTRLESPWQVDCEELLFSVMGQDSTCRSGKAIAAHTVSPTVKHHSVRGAHLMAKLAFLQGAFDSRNRCLSHCCGPQLDFESAECSSILSSWSDKPAQRSDNQGMIAIAKLTHILKNFNNCLLVCQGPEG